MNARPKTLYVCSSCGNEAAKWQGQCPACGEWNTLSALAVPTRARARRAAGGAPTAASGATLLGTEATEDAPRLATGSAESDR
jgi:DNA repair protein RadA/Sms